MLKGLVKISVVVASVLGVLTYALLDRQLAATQRGSVIVPAQQTIDRMLDSIEFLPDFSDLPGVPTTDSGSPGIELNGYAQHPAAPVV
jgi:hypothetical protein